MSFVSGPNFRLLPPVWEMGQPFRIDATGQVAYDTDPNAWARNHLLSLLLTDPGERVMRPSYGAGLRAFVFENNDAVAEQQLMANLQRQVSQYEPSIVLKDVNIAAEPGSWGTFQINISFTVGSSGLQSIAISSSGQGTEVSVQ